MFIYTIFVINKFFIHNICLYLHHKSVRNLINQLTNANVLVMNDIIIKKARKKLIKKVDVKKTLLAMKPLTCVEYTINDMLPGNVKTASTELKSDKAKLKGKYGEFEFKALSKTKYEVTRLK